MNTNPNLYIIIQARMTSSRLPGKILLPLGEKPILQVMIERLTRLKHPHKIIIATTNDDSEGPIIDFCKKHQIDCFKGHPNDVLKRFYDTAKSHQLQPNDLVIRLTSDCPFIDPQIIDNMLLFYKNNSYDYVSNAINKTYPLGLSAEIFSFKMLCEAHQEAKKPFEREHVTPFMYHTNPKNYKIGSFEDTQNNAHYRLTIDEKDDYLCLQALSNALNHRLDFTYEELIHTLNKNPHIAKLNASVNQKGIES
jgi:spore coat polysaccharide biosynthesis protein SpsF